VANCVEKRCNCAREIVWKEVQCVANCVSRTECKKSQKLLCESLVYFNARRSSNANELSEAAPDSRGRGSRRPTHGASPRERGQSGERDDTVC
jgi:hypothetical protein